jgi:energy-coupling factor transporter ATP-binding protein EcfA2
MVPEDKPLTGQRIGLFGRGGSGKSTCTVLLAKALARAGYAVCVVDADSTNEGLPQALGADKTCGSASWRWRSTLLPPSVKIPTSGKRGWKAVVCTALARRQKRPKSSGPSNRSAVVSRIGVRVGRPRIPRLTDHQIQPITQLIQAL